MVPKPTQAPRKTHGKLSLNDEKTPPLRKGFKGSIRQFLGENNTSATSTSQQRLSRSRHISPTHFEPRSLSKSEPTKRLGESVTSQKKKGADTKTLQLKLQRFEELQILECYIFVGDGCVGLLDTSWTRF